MVQDLRSLQDKALHLLREEAGRMPNGCRKDTNSVVAVVAGIVSRGCCQLADMTDGVGLVLAV